LINVSKYANFVLKEFYNTIQKRRLYFLPGRKVPGRKIIITNAYMKKFQKVSKRDLEKARNMKKAYADRIKGGIYYEKN